jgi:type VI secretion system protein
MGVTLHFQSTGTVPGNARPVQMFGGSITVGRGPENDLVLPDPTKVLSKRHCAIEEQGGQVVLIDLSTNGTFLNYGKTPVGKAPKPLNDGDILTLGPYELLVEVSGQIAAPSEPDPAPAARTVSGSAGRSGLADALDDILDGPSEGGDFLDDLLGEGAAPKGPKSVSRPELGEDGLLPPLDEDDLLGPARDPFGGTGPSQSDHSPSATDHVRVSNPVSQPIPEDWGDDLLGPSKGGSGKIPSDPDFGGPVTPAGRPDDPFDWQPEEVNAPEPGGDAAARAFLKAAGVAGLNIPDGELEETLSRMGHVFRIMVRGMREILMARATVKSEFRIDQTMIAAGGNNPLKFSVSPEQAVEAMVKPSTTGYLDATRAAEEALKDIRAHEIAMVTGMEAALKGVLKELSPEALEGRIEVGGGLSSVLKGKKARYWEVYEKLYGEISDQAENDFHELFAKEFARAYKAQLEKLK